MAYLFEIGKARWHHGNTAHTDTDKHARTHTHTKMLNIKHGKKILTGKHENSPIKSECSPKGRASPPAHPTPNRFTHSSKAVLF